MSPHIALIVTAASALLLAAWHQSQASSPVNLEGLEAFVDAAMASGMEEENIPGAAFILVRDGSVVLAKGYGKADLESGRVFTADQTIFPIASVSKVFTATAAMQLVDDGTIDLGADVNRYLGSVQVPPAYSEPVTLAHLLSHTAGFDELPGRRVRSATELMPLGKFLSNRLVRVHAPGEVTSYSSYGMSLAGLLVEEVSDRPFETYLRRHIWEPLGMTRTSITVPEDKSVLATAYELDDDKPVPVPYEIYQTPPVASILSTAQDMGRFMSAHLQGGRYGESRILSEKATKQIQRRHATMHPKLPGWTLGFQENDLNGLRIIEHGGDIGGFSSLLTLLPDQGVGFFIVHHLESNNLRFDVRQAILDRYFPDSRKVKLPVPDSETADRLRRFAGKYRGNIFCHTCPDGGPNVQDFEVEANDDGTITVWGDRWVEVSPRYFVGLDGRSRIGFAEDKSGRITALSAGSWKVLERID
jgi:CubicO group peptidase (beta-lactamase class C family)